jgi:hypothetical protein
MIPEVGQGSSSQIVGFAAKTALVKTESGQQIGQENFAGI